MTFHLIDLGIAGGPSRKRHARAPERQTLTLRRPQRLSFVDRQPISWDHAKLQHDGLAANMRQGLLPDCDIHEVDIWKKSVFRQRRLFAESRQQL